MILFALVLAQAAAPDAKAQEVVVIGQSLKTWRASYRSRDGKVTCVIKRSSGDHEVDVIGCAALTECAGPMNKKAIAILKDRVLTAEARKQAQGALNDEMGRCMMTRRDALITALAERRADARAGS